MNKTAAEFLRGLDNLMGQTVDERLANEAGCHAADVERLTARYEWLRSNLSEDARFFATGRVIRSGEDFDAAVDEGMAR